MKRAHHARNLLAAGTLALLGGLAFAAPAGAQASQVDPKHAPAEKIEPCPGKTAGSLKCGPGTTHTPARPQHRPARPIHSKKTPTAAGKPAGDQNLSRHLEQNNGTIKPPPVVDPGMTVTPRQDGSGNMPVIPPPGTPGGNPKIVPK